MSSIGEALRRERVRRNLTLDRVSQDLKISARLLEAIEQERFDKLPGGVFTKSFVRQYARFLELDEDDIAQELQRTLDPEPSVASASQASHPVAEIPLPRVKEWEAVGDHGFRWSSSLPALALVVVVMLVCSGVYSWWQRSRRLVAAHENQPVVARNTPPPAQPQSPPAKVESPEAPTPASAPASTPAPAAAAASVPAAGAQPAQVAAPTPVQPAPVPSQPPNPNAAVRVQLTAQEPVWISARSDGKNSFTGTLDANQTQTVEANKDVVLRLGNAGGVNIVLNGKPIGPVGPRGQVRTLQLTSGGFQIVPPEAPKPATPPPAEPLDPL